MSTIESKSVSDGKMPRLFRYTYTFELPVRTPDPASGGMDTVFSHMATVTSQFDVVALTAEFADAAFKLARPASLYTLTKGPEAICYIDGIIHAASSYGGHFS
jgi:hypothetical protein